MAEEPIRSVDADYAELQRKMAIMNPESPGGDEESQAAALNREAQRIQAEAEKSATAQSGSSSAGDDAPERSARRVHTQDRS